MSYVEKVPLSPPSGADSQPLSFQAADNNVNDPEAGTRKVRKAYRAGFRRGYSIAAVLTLGMGLVVGGLILFGLYGPENFRIGKRDIASRKLIPPFLYPPPTISTSVHSTALPVPTPKPTPWPPFPKHSSVEPHSSATSRITVLPTPWPPFPKPSHASSTSTDKSTHNDILRPRAPRRKKGKYALRPGHPYPIELLSFLEVWFADGNLRKLKSMNLEQWKEWYSYFPFNTQEHTRKRAVITAIRMALKPIGSLDGGDRDRVKGFWQTLQADRGMQWVFSEKRDGYFTSITFCEYDYGGVNTVFDALVSLKIDDQRFKDRFLFQKVADELNTFGEPKTPTQQDLDRFEFERQKTERIRQNMRQRLVEISYGMYGNRGGGG